MRNLSVAFLEALAGDDLKIGFLYEAEFLSGMVRVWTGIGTLEALDETWKGVGAFGEISTMSEGAGVRADGIEARLCFKLPGTEHVDIPEDLAAVALEQTVQGAPVRVFWALFESDGGKWVLVDDPQIWFKGRIDIPRLSGVGGDLAFILSAENRMATFKRSRGGKYSAEEQKRRYPGDLGLDFIHELSQQSSAMGRGESLGEGDAGAQPLNKRDGHVEHGYDHIILYGDSVNPLHMHRD